ncbi:uracil-DNA glycosylase family protein [Rhodoferax antarcticus]|uniref:Uracil-DNA glycosylase n=1 Tax=Rhodoferax antarcticus ANT.BR TaxID=1111071 RepID=A0A1Q8YHW5_9BURK|nr:uracil-DNA glycosylase family protein [Rhodoferax antarcticus]APW47884.1 hypothetical protein RA876_17735 [Rhodoferax antarcticus]MCW2312264.1 uracil-DNA glycosylase [Rhodoferax antarcticus]OLP07658.1 uracil-DNA glycosylase [Rhodoferax antarcticus ANT.BR]
MKAVAQPRQTVAITPYQDLDTLLADARSCRVCKAHLPLGPRPVLQAAPSARILVVGQAPGVRVHTSGIPWDDASGERLHAWTGLSNAHFYDASKAEIIPMGFCYFGRGRGRDGDLPPGRECAPDYLALPHPCARNSPWFQRNPWFEQEVLPALRQRVASL